MVQVSAKTENSAEINFEYTFGDNIAELVTEFGEDVVFSHALRALTVATQGHARSMIKSGKTEPEIVEAMKTWKPGAPRVTKSAEDKAAEALAALTPEQRAKLLKDLKASQRAAA